MLVSPFNYKRHELQVFYDYEKKTSEEKPSVDNKLLFNLFENKDTKLPIECYVFWFSIKKFVRNMLGCGKKDEKKEKFDEENLKKDEINESFNILSMDDLMNKMHYILHKKYDKSSFVQIDRIEEVQKHIDRVAS